MASNPLRTCLMTRKKLPQSQLIRIGLCKSIQNSNNLEVCIIKDNKEISGRTTYIQPDDKLIEIALKKNIFANYFKLNRSLTEDEITQIREDFMLVKKTLI